MVALYSDHEEADTRMLLHASHAAQTSDTVIIKSSDTDVILLAIGHSFSINAHLLMLTGTCKHLKQISILAFKEHFGEKKCTSLLGLHIFTGCAFKRKGKAKALKLLLEHESFIKTFSILGQSWLLSDDGFIALEVLCVCCMVNHSAQISTVHGTIYFAQA